MGSDDTWFKNSDLVDTLEPAFRSLTHVGGINIHENWHLTTWTSGGGCPTDLEEVCRFPNVDFNVRLPNCVVNRCIEHMQPVICQPGPWCRRYHQVAQESEDYELPGRCTAGNIYECTNHLGCSCSGNAMMLSYGCNMDYCGDGTGPCSHGYCTTSGYCDEDLDLECVAFQYNEELGKEVGSCSGVPEFNFYCENAICPESLGCTETDAPMGDPERCICD